jgi:mannose-1-phosphate guanylyltransferase
MAFRTPTPSSCGILKLDDQGVVVGFHEKVAHPPGNLASGAIYLLSPEFLALAASELRMVADFSTEVIPELIGQMFIYETTAPFVDVGSPKAYEHANQTHRKIED